MAFLLFIKRLFARPVINPEMKQLYENIARFEFTSICTKDNL